MLEPTLFPLASTHLALFVLRPQEHDLWTLSVRVGANPLQDDDPDVYEDLTAGEVLDVMTAVASLHLGV